MESCQFAVAASTKWLRNSAVVAKKLSAGYFDAVPPKKTLRRISDAGKYLVIDSHPGAEPVAVDPVLVVAVQVVRVREPLHRGAVAVHDEPVMVDGVVIHA